MSVWIAHVKKYCQKNNCNYRDALRDPKCKDSYHKSIHGRGSAASVPRPSPPKSPVATDERMLSNKDAVKYFKLFKKALTHENKKRVYTSEQKRQLFDLLKQFKDRPTEGMKNHIISTLDGFINEEIKDRRKQKHERELMFNEDPLNQWEFSDDED